MLTLHHRCTCPVSAEQVCPIKCPLSVYIFILFYRQHLLNPQSPHTFLCHFAGMYRDLYAVKLVENYLSFPLFPDLSTTTTTQFGIGLFEVCLLHVTSSFWTDIYWTILFSSFSFSVEASYNSKHFPHSLITHLRAWAFSTYIFHETVSYSSLWLCALCSVMIVVFSKITGIYSVT